MIDEKKPSEAKIEKQIIIMGNESTIEMFVTYL